MKRYFDRYGTDIRPGMIIRCTLDNADEKVHTDDSGELGILGAKLDGLTTCVHPLWNFDGKYMMDGYALEDFEIVG